MSKAILKKSFSLQRVVKKNGQDLFPKSLLPVYRNDMENTEKGKRKKKREKTFEDKKKSPTCHYKKLTWAVDRKQNNFKGWPNSSSIQHVSDNSPFCRLTGMLSVRRCGSSECGKAKSGPFSMSIVFLNAIIFQAAQRGEMGHFKKKSPTCHYKKLTWAVDRKQNNFKGWPNSSSIQHVSDNSPFCRLTGMLSVRRCGSSECGKAKSGPFSMSIVFVARFPDRAKSESV